jgi:site-specific DNA-methyltransferase (adenine-specific)
MINETIQLHLGDCLEVMKNIPDGSVDMVLSDPPYGMDYQSNRRAATPKFDKIIQDTGVEWLDDFCSEIHRIMRENSAAYVFCSWHNVDLFKQAFERKFKIKNLLVWVKNNHGSGDLLGAYAPKYEFVFFLHKGRCLLRDGRRPDVLEYAKVNGSKMVHPTEKPVDLLQRFIIDASDVGDTVLDPFMGSGTTGVACVNTNRKFIGIELDEKYFEIAKKRIEGTKKQDGFFAP